MNTQTLTIHITLNKGKNLPPRVLEQITDAIEERLQEADGEQTTGERLGVGYIAFEHKGKVVHEYCGA